MEQFAACDHQDLAWLLPAPVLRLMWVVEVCSEARVPFAHWGFECLCRKFGTMVQAASVDLHLIRVREAKM